MALDLDDPIVPGHSAAGIVLGTSITPILGENEGIFTSEPVFDALGRSSGARYRSTTVDLWSMNDDDTVTQIMVHGHYRGRLMGHISIGSSVTDIETLVGPCDEDEEDNLVIQGLPGLAIEIASTYADPAWKDAPITELYVFRAQSLL